GPESRNPTDAGIQSRRKSLLAHPRLRARDTASRRRESPERHLLFRKSEWTKRRRGSRHLRAWTRSIDPDRREARSDALHGASQLEDRSSGLSVRSYSVGRRA